LSSTDLSFVQSAQIALEAQGIKSAVSDENRTGLPSNPITLAVSDADYSRAVRVVQGLQETTARGAREMRWVPRALLFVLIMLIITLCAVLILR